MKAHVLSALDGPDAVCLADVDDPRPGPGDVLIDVRASGVSFPELLYTYGRYQERPELPVVLGVEVSGLVTLAPPGSALRVGQPVVAATFHGGWAEQVVVPAEFVAARPDGLDHGQGAALVMNYHTAWFCLADRGRLTPGEHVLVLGAAGGLGVAAIQVARALGAIPVAVVSTAQKAQYALDAGAAHALVGGSESWTEQVRAVTGGRGVDVVFDVVGDRPVDVVRSLAPRGRYVVVGFASGEIPTLRLNRLLLTNTDVVGAAWGPAVKADSSMFARIAAELAAAVRAGHVRPPVGLRLDFEHLAAGLHCLERREALGKIVIERGAAHE